ARHPAARLAVRRVDRTPIRVTAVAARERHGHPLPRATEHGRAHRAHPGAVVCRLLLPLPRFSPHGPGVCSSRAAVRPADDAPSATPRVRPQPAGKPRRRAVDPAGQRVVDVANRVVRGGVPDAASVRGAPARHAALRVRGGHHRGGDLAWPVQQSWQRIYSPYQLLELGYSDAGLMVIRAAGHYYQRVHDLSSPRANDDPRRRQVRDYYDLPYRVRPAPADVAVVGAGAGNDVAAALRGGAVHIDAIEIDPAILWAGRANHPERPYSNARVLPIANDARSFLRPTERTDNLICFGLLELHTLLSHAS